MSIENPAKPTFERLRGVELDCLSNELFFHELRPSRKKEITNFHKINLYGLNGRATIIRGGVASSGIFACYRIPINEQRSLFHQPFNSQFEDWVAGSQILLALRSPISCMQEAEALKWLEIMRSERSPSPPYQKKVQIDISNIRFLHAEYFLAGIKIEETSPDIMEEQYINFPQKVRVVNDINLRKSNLSEDSIVLAMANYFNRRFELKYRRDYLQ